MNSGWEDLFEKLACFPLDNMKGVGIKYGHTPIGIKEDGMKTLIAKLEGLLELGGIKKDVALLALSGIAAF